MRSSKSRSRSKPNRPRSMGNIVNRVFDSSGPEGKVRGTPQQIIDKYLVLARDAQLSNDRVAAENFLQHAEHYTRMLAEAQREMHREAEERNNNQQNRGEGRDDSRDNNRDSQQGGGQTQQGGRDDARGDRRHDGNRDDRDQPRDDRDQSRDDGGQRRQRGGGQMRATDVIDFSEGADSGLVETPEARRSPQPQSDQQLARDTAAEPAAGEAPSAKRRRRSPVRKPKPAATEGENAKADEAGAARKASAAE